MTETDSKQTLTLKKRDRSADEENPFNLPGDIRRKRIFWLLSVVFAAMLVLGILLLILLLGIVRPPGFVGGTFSPVANFRSSIYGPADALLDRPSGIAISPAGEIYASDTGNARVVVFDQDGLYLRSITTLLSAAEQDATNLDQAEESDHASYVTPLPYTPQAFVAPTSLDFAADGRWFAVDQALHMLLLFDQHDQLLRAVTFEEEAPIGVNVNFVSNVEQLFVTTRSGIVAGDLDGNFNLTYLNWGILGGQMDNPTAVVVFDPARMDSEASISATDTTQLTIVADALNNRVKAFKNFQTSPELVWVYGKPLTGIEAAAVDLDLQIENQIIGRVSLPVDLALSPLGRLFVLDGLSSEVIVLNAQSGEALYTISDVGTRDGLLYYPAGICFYRGSVFIADRFNDRLSIFEDAPPAPVVPEEVPVEPFNRWLLLILPLTVLLATLLRLLSLRMPRYVVDLRFLENLADDPDLLQFVDNHFTKLTLVAGTESAAEDMLPGFNWRTQTASEKKRDALVAENAGLSELEADAVLIASRRKHSGYLLTASRLVEKLAEGRGIKVVRFAEFRTIAQAIIEEERAIQE
ncbi:MAG: NHL repeat-containing protein [Coriobacteriia bacterium]|nr:NHL repeat-containing protein [Coriobacteriia bacterium]